MVNKTPQIIIAMSTMMSGGIEKSLATLLNSLDGRNINITLLLNEKKGIFLNAIPEWVNVVEIKYLRNITNERKLGRKRFLLDLLLKFKFLSLKKYLRIFSEEKSLQHDEMMISRFRRYQEGIVNDELFNQEYDLAVAYADFEQMILTADKIKSQRKITFFHTQIEGLTNNVRKYRDIFQNYDTWFCVSNDLTNSMKKHFPEFSNRIKTFPHIINVRQIKTSGIEYTADWPGKGLRLLSVGRLETQKGFDLIPAIARKLSENRVEFQWAILGEGPKHSMIEKTIVEHGLSQQVFLLGAKENPYPYFASCDIYVQPSRYEGYCLTLAEARVFFKPIVTTYFDGSNEQLEGGKCGKIVKCEIGELFLAVKELCDKPQLRAAYTEALKHQNIENSRGSEIFIEEVRKSVDC